MASFLEDSVDQLPSGPTPKRHRPESVVTQWVESISGSEFYRERHCRSDTLLGHPDGELIPRRLTKSVPNMEYTRDADGFVMPPTPTSWYAPSVAASGNGSASTGSSRRKSLVEDPSYRRTNLGENNIYMRPVYEEFPEDIAGLVDHMGTGEPVVEEYFHAHVFPKPKLSDSLQRTNKNPIARHAVPDVGSKLKVSTPVPDMLYGYNSIGAFPKQQAQPRSMGNEMVANSQDLIYPFFVVEFKADGPGGSGSFIAMSGTKARLYISWKHNELDYYMQKVRSFSLQEPEQYVEFRKHVRSIIDWGNDERLKEIRKSLDSLLEENRKSSSAVKPHPSPNYLCYYLLGLDQDNPKDLGVNNFWAAYHSSTLTEDGCAGREVSFSQVVRLIASIGHVEKIIDFTLKPIEQHSFLLTGFSRHTSSRPTFGGTTLSTTTEAGRDHINATRTQPKEGRAVNAGALASRRSKPSISDSESSSDDDGCSSEDEQGRSSEQAGRAALAGIQE
ncbi:hypothetical protein G7Y89_g5508 [Cudoniella acicularis]|uniref:Uncharacterized protein n=1 Tax=Cudoniella acicularis TaxID=354080 RepID=A0A8H4RQJ3_9HELO|nr:hypothetical protein G7Y89_g5508 [Cudoniella acicularis]